MASQHSPQLPVNRELGELYEELFPSVYSYVSYRVGDQAQTEDIVSIVFLQAAKKYSQFTWHHNQSFNAWIFKIARNAIWDFHRKQNAERFSIDIDAVPEIASQEAPIEGQILMKEQFKLLRELIGTLAPRAQEVIALRFFGGLSNKEVALVLDIDQRSVSSYLSRGLRDLEEKHIQRTRRQGEGEVHNEE